MVWFLKQSLVVFIIIDIVVVIIVVFNEKFSLV